MLPTPLRIHALPGLFPILAVNSLGNYARHRTLDIGNGGRERNLTGRPRNPYLSAEFSANSRFPT
jgi:hypothetical protein